MNDLHLRVTRLIQNELGTTPDRLGPDSHLAELGDSLDWFSLIVAVETEFGVCIDEAQERSLVTVTDLVRLLETQAVAPAA